MVSFISLAMLIAHTIGWKPLTVDSTSLVLLSLVLFSPFLSSLRKIKIGDFEAEIDPQEVTRVKDQVEAHVPEAVKDKDLGDSRPEVQDTVQSIQELVKTDPVMALAKLRIELEKVLRRLFKLAFPKQTRFLAIGHMIRELTVTESLSPNIMSPLQQVVSLCNRAIHGEEIRHQDAVVVADVGTSLLVNLHTELSNFAPRPVESQDLSKDDVEDYEQAMYRVITVIPHAETPIRNVYRLSQEGLDRFLDSNGDYAEFIIEVKRLPPD